MDVRIYELILEVIHKEKPFRKSQRQSLQAIIDSDQKEEEEDEK